jgi:ATP-dependent Clp protease ATP-binding subunit ClpA
VLLIGPTGTGKTATIEALPAALAALGRDGARVFRIDCGELTDSIQLTRLLGAPPGYVGHAGTTPLLDALARPGCILLLDEIEKAHPDVHDLLLGLLDAGRLTSPGGEATEAPHCVVALTSNLHVDRLAEQLVPVAAGDRWAVQRVCREHLVDAGLPPELVGRIGAFAVFTPLGDEAYRHAAEGAVRALAGEYGLMPASVDPVVLDVVVDIAGETGIGVRALYHAARELLAEAFAAAIADGLRGSVAIAAGPPVEVRRARRSSARRSA